VCHGVAIAESELPAELLGPPELAGRVFCRGGEREVRFLWDMQPRLLPVRRGGRISLVAWGSSDRRSRLPTTCWTWIESVEAGKWNAFEPELVTIPSNFALDRGVWYLAREGIRGVLVKDEEGEDVVYMVCKQPSRYYAVMTKGTRQPVLLGDQI
jgi:hypothetical protein